LINGINKNILTQRAMVVNLAEVATEIEDILSNYLPSYPLGVYLNGKAEPTLIPGQQYYFEKVVARDLTEYWAIPAHLRPMRPVDFDYVYEPVTDISEVLNQPWDIVQSTCDVEQKVAFYNPNTPLVVQNAIPTYKVVATHHELKGAAMQPNLPMYGLQLLYDIIENAIFKEMVYETGHPIRENEDIVSKYVTDPFPKQDPELRYSSGFFTLTSTVYAACKDILTSLKSFMGDNEGYSLYELNKHSPITLLVEYKGDFRIHDWTRRMNDETWK
jgi:hypothetical protein